MGKERLPIVSNAHLVKSFPSFRFVAKCYFKCLFLFLVMFIISTRSIPSESFIKSCPTNFDIANSSPRTTTKPRSIPIYHSRTENDTSTKLDALLLLFRGFLYKSCGDYTCNQKKLDSTPSKEDS